jgi:hypothetical protein
MAHDRGLSEALHQLAEQATGDDQDQDLGDEERRRRLAGRVGGEGGSGGAEDQCADQRHDQRRRPYTGGTRKPA